jgi:hypothetical protein
MALKNWSTTAANNNASPPDGAPEGWSSNQVNDWGRETMAQVRGGFENLPWFDWGDTPTYVSTTSVTVPGDITAREVVANKSRVRATVTSGNIYGILSSATYSSSTLETTLVFTWDSTSLDNSVSAIAFGIDDGNLDLLTKTLASSTYLTIAEGQKNGADGSNFDDTITAAKTLTAADSGIHYATPSATAAVPFTLPASPVAGNNYAIDSNASYQVSIDPNGGTFLFPDASTSTSSFNLPLADGSTAYIIFDGTNWHLFQTGSTIVANAVNANEAPNMGQFVGIGHTTGGTATSASISFTAPSNGVLVAVGTGSGYAQGSLTFTNATTVNSNAAWSSSAQGSITCAIGSATVVSGAAVTATITISNSNGSVGIVAIFLPTP